MLPLTYANKNETNIIKKVSGKPEVRQHLADLGFVAGTPVKIMQSHNGDMIVKIRDSKLAITREMAAKIMVEY